MKIMLEPDTSPGRIGLLSEQLSPRTAFWEAEMWVRPEVLRRDQIDPPPTQCLLWPLLHNLNPQASEDSGLGCWCVETHYGFVKCIFLNSTDFVVG